MPYRHHPFLGLFVLETERRPPAHRLLQEILAEHDGHPALPLVMLLVAADRECRAGRLPLATVLLSLAANHPALSQPGPEQHSGIEALHVARQEAVRGDRARCAAAIGTAIFALLQDHGTTH
jgi:hypothetical protein